MATQQHENHGQDSSPVGSALFERNFRFTSQNVFSLCP